MEDLLKLKTVKKDSKAAKQIITRLFGYYVFDERFFEDDQYTPNMINFVDTQQLTQDTKDVNEAENLLAQNTEIDNRFNQAVIPQGSVPPPQAVDTNLLAQAPNNTGIMKNLSSTERALLSPSEQEIAMRS